MKRSETWEYLRQQYQKVMNHKDKEHCKCWQRACDQFEHIVKPESIADLTQPRMAVYSRVVIHELGYMPSTADRNISLMQSMFNWLANNGFIPYPLKLPKPRARDLRYEAGRALTDLEFNRMLEMVPRVTNRRVAELRRLMWGLWLSGMRLGEARKLYWDKSQPFHIDMDGYDYPMLVTRASLYGTDKANKTRVTPLTKDFAEWLGRFSPKGRFGLVYKNIPWDRPKLVGKISRCGYLADVVTRQEPLKYASAHDFRRSFGTRWAKLVTPVVLQKLMRHSNIHTTLNYYIHLNAEELAKYLWEMELPKNWLTPPFGCRPVHPQVASAVVHYGADQEAISAARAAEIAPRRERLLELQARKPKLGYMVRKHLKEAGIRQNELPEDWPGPYIGQGDLIDPRRGKGARKLSVSAAPEPLSLPDYSSSDTGSPAQGLQES